MKNSANDQLAVAWRWSVCIVALMFGAIMSNVGVEQALHVVPPIAYHLVRIVLLGIYAVQAARHALAGKIWPIRSIQILAPICLLNLLGESIWPIKVGITVVGLCGWFVALKIMYHFRKLKVGN